MDRREIPGLAAIFVVIFDQKVGYTLSWKRTIPQIDLDGAEYKSLPSGLHAIKEDLVYFDHGSQYAGISLFVQSAADSHRRNAHFVAVGALVPLSGGMLGRGWLHSEYLRRLARDFAGSVEPDYRPIELYWNKHRQHDSAVSEPSSATPPRSPIDSKKRKRAYSEATMAGFGVQDLMPIDHPALSAAMLVDAFGPLLFPLQRAALSRKRILILANPPVQHTCNAVYIVSVLSNLSRSQGESLPPASSPLLRSRPLYNVGIHDIMSLEQMSHENGWLACTTDDILREKTKLWDILVELPSNSANLAWQWPRIQSADGVPIKATQRDVRKWKLLLRELQNVKHQMDTSSAAVDPEESQGTDTQPLLASTREEGGSKADPARYSIDLVSRDVSDVVELSTWGALAYKGFMWWASAGEASTWESDEARLDEELFTDMPSFTDVLPFSHTSANDGDRDIYLAQISAALVIAYFRRLNEKLLRTMASIVEEADDMTEEGVEEDIITLSVDDVREMGLDAWSTADKDYLITMMKMWLAHDAMVTDGVKVCGVRVC